MGFYQRLTSCRCGSLLSMVLLARNWTIYYRRFSQILQRPMRWFIANQQQTDYQPYQHTTWRAFSPSLLITLERTFLSFFRLPFFWFFWQSGTKKNVKLPIKPTTNWSCWRTVVHWSCHGVHPRQRSKARGCQRPASDLPGQCLTSKWFGGTDPDPFRWTQSAGFNAAEHSSGTWRYLRIPTWGNLELWFSHHHRRQTSSTRATWCIIRSQQNRGWRHEDADLIATWTKSKW